MAIDNSENEFNNKIISGALEVIKFYYDQIFPAIYEYSTLLYTLGIEKLPEQLNYYRTDAFLDITFALYNSQLSYEEKRNKLANAKEHLTLNGTELIEYFVLLRLNRIHKKINYLKGFLRVKFFKKSSIFFDSLYLGVHKDIWYDIKKQKSINFQKTKSLFEQILKGIDEIEAIFIDPKKCLLYSIEMEKFDKFKKALILVTGVCGVVSVCLILIQFFIL